MLTAMAVRTCWRWAWAWGWAGLGSAVAHAVAVGKLADGALDAGPDGVALVPGGVLLVGAVTDLQVVEFARGEPTVRLPSLEVVQAARTGQGWHCPW